MGYQKIQVPSSGDKITVNADNTLNVPDNPIIPYIEGDGIGVDISPVMINRRIQPDLKRVFLAERGCRVINPPIKFLGLVPQVRNLTN